MRFMICSATAVPADTGEERDVSALLGTAIVRERCKSDWRMKSGVVAGSKLPDIVSSRFIDDD